MSRTLVAFHAHPDDEALLTAGTMAKAAAAGHRVVLVVATSGEIGQVAPDLLHDGESLGERRRRELQASAEAIGVHRLELLGYHDSGHVPAEAPDGAFVRADPDEAAGRLARILDEETADVLTVYDPNGGYGHPDHVKVHDVGYRAAQLAGTPRVLEATFNRDLLEMAVDLVPSLGYELPEGFVPPDTSTWFLPGDAITHHVDVSAHLDAKRASMAAHASQASADIDTVRTLAVFLSLPDDLYALAFGTEYFVDRACEPGTRFDDVFAPLVGRRAGTADDPS